MPSIFVFLQLQSTCPGIVQDSLQAFQCTTFSVAIYMHGYSAREFTSPLIISLSVAIYIHGYSASIESSERSASIRVAIYMHGYSASSGAEVLFVIWLVAIYTWFRG